MGTTDANGVYTPARDEEDWDPEIAANFDLFSQVITDFADHEIAADPHPGLQRESQRAVASGYASLDASTKVPIAQLPTGTSSTTVALGNAAAGLDAAHVAASDPHPGYLKDADISLTADISPTAISATQDDYNPTGLSTASTLRLATSSSTQRNISGLAGGADGRVLLVHNVGPGPLAFLDEGTGSTAANRFALAGDMILAPDGSCLVQYDSTSSRWRMLARATAATNPALTFGTTNAGGTSPYFVRSDDQLALFDATVPTTQAFGDAAVAGSAGVAARRDHKHAMPAAPTLATDTLAAAKGDIPVASANDAFSILTAPTVRQQRLGADAAGNVSWSPLASAKNGVRLWDEMMYQAGVVVANTGWQMGAMSVGLVGVASALTIGTGTASHPGVVSLDTGTSTSGSARLSMSSLSTLFGGGRARFGAWVNIPVLSVAAQRFEIMVGFADAFTGAGLVDAAAFSYIDTVNSGAWTCNTVANSVSTATVTGSGITVVAGTWYFLEVEVNAAGTSVVYYIDGATVATHAANIPTGAGRETGARLAIQKSLGTTSESLLVDAYYLELDFTTPR